MPITVADNEIVFTVFDDDVLTSDVIGSFEINPHKLCVNEGVKRWYVIKHKGEEAGQIELETKFTSNEETKWAQELLKENINRYQGC